MKLYNLPLDILFLILEYTEKNDLLSLSHSSHGLREVAALKLWRTLSIGVDVDSLADEIERVVQKPYKYIPKRNRISITTKKQSDFGKLIECSKGNENVLSCVETLRIDGNMFHCEKSMWKGWYGWTFEGLLRTLSRRCTSLRVVEYKPRTLGNGIIDTKEMQQVFDIFSSVNGLRTKIEVNELDEKVFWDLKDRRLTSLEFMLARQPPISRFKNIRLSRWLQTLKITVCSTTGWATLNDSALKNMLCECERLVSVSLEGAFAIHTLNWLPSNVTELELRSRDGICIKTLESLHSTKLKRLEIDFPSYTVFNLIDCPNLDSLAIHNHDLYMVKHMGPIISALKNSTKIKNFSSFGVEHSALCHILSSTKWKLERLVVTIPNQDYQEIELDLSKFVHVLATNSANSLSTLVIDHIDNWLPTAFEQLRKVDLENDLFYPLVKKCVRLHTLYTTHLNEHCKMFADLPHDLVREPDTRELIQDMVINPRVRTNLQIRKANLNLAWA